MFEIAICEDNKSFSSELETIVNRKFIQHNLECKIQCFYSGEDILDSVLNNTENHDIIFFDIDLPKLSGIEVARKIREVNESIIFIFITCLNQKVYEALDLSIFHFVRKDHFYKEINSVIDLLIKNLNYLTKSYPFLIGDTSIYFKLYSITYIEVLNRKIILHTLNDSYISNYRSLKDLPFDWIGNHFYEVYNGIIVNLNHVKEFVDNKIILSGESIVYVSRRKLHKFKEEFFKYISSNR